MKDGATLAIYPVRRPDSSVVGLHESPADRQTKAHTIPIAFVTILNLIEVIEDAIGEMRGNPWSIISNRHG